MTKVNKLFIVLLFLTNYLFSLQAQESNKSKAYLVADAHLDTQWNWDVQTTINEYVPNTMNQNIFLLKRYPNYIFNFEGGLKYAWMKEYYPDKYEEVKNYIRQGRWHVAGASWDANEVLVSSTESLIRNILLGQTFYKKEFGLKSSDIFLPDCFGFGWTLPTVANHCGLIGFSTQKLQWRSSGLTENMRQYPFTIGLWQGIDGSRIMAAANGFGYGDEWPDEDLSYSNNLKDLAGWSPTNTVYHYYGTGDIGGSPTIASVSGVEKGVKGDGPVQIISATSSQMYEDYLPFDAHPELPVYDGEMLMDVHGNACYTSQAAMKLYNRQNEILGVAAEQAAVIADWMNPGTYPGQDLTESWQRFIWHQFHDDLTGTSIPKAYQFSWNDELLSLSRFSNILTTSVSAISDRLDTKVKGTPVVVHNPSSFLVKDMVIATISVVKEPASVAVSDDKGRSVAAQKLSYEDGKLSVLFSASVPSMGFVVYDIVPQGKKSSVSPFIVNENTIENSIYKITLDGNGDIASIVDKRSGREMVQDGKSIRLAMFTNNKSFHWPAWEITRDVINSQPVAIESGAKVSVVENGVARASLCVERQYKGSTIKQYIRLTNGGQDDRIDIYNEIDWNTQSTLLKAEFPLNVSNEFATYDLGLGSIKRATNKHNAFETYAHYWADLTGNDGQYGVTFLNDGKYGWDKPDANTLRLTLLHTPQAESAFYYQSEQDLGYHTFTYSIVGHQGDCPQAEVVRKGEALNQSLKAFVVGKHAGSLGKSFSFTNVEQENVIIKTLKKAEDDDDYILRVYETAGKETNGVSLAFAGGILKAEEANGIEEVIAPANVTGGKLVFDMKPYSLRTFKLKLQQPRNLKPASPRYKFVDLNYDLQCTTYNEFRKTADFDGTGCTYAAELLPDTLYSDRMAFRMGNKTRNNGIRCKGDTIWLPQDGTYNQLNLLMSSTLGDYKGGFKLGSITHELIVPYYSGFYGQWGHKGYTKGYVKDADLAYIGTHRHDMNGNRDRAYEFTYLFKYKINLGRTDRYLVLPENTRIVLFAATLSSEENPGAVSAQPLFRTSLKENTFSAASFPTHNLILNKEVIASSGCTSEGDRPESMIDGNYNNHWADYHKGVPNYVDIDMGAVQPIKAWRVVHAGDNASPTTTKDFELLGKASIEEEWQSLDKITGNTLKITDRNLKAPVDIRYIRLEVTRPVRDGGDIARICELEVY